MSSESVTGNKTTLGQLNSKSRLEKALIEIENHVGYSGWDQPARLFALAKTADLVSAEPSLSDQIDVSDLAGFSSIEQDDFHAGEDILDELARIRWSDAVIGVALSLERCFLPAESDPQIPLDSLQAGEYVANHPDRQDIRVVVGVLRSGETHSVARLASHSGELLSGTGMVPTVEQALLATLD